MSVSSERNSRRWLDVPPSANIVRVRIIDAAGNMVVPASAFLEPVGKGHELLNGTTSCFLVENERLGKKAVFDLGLRKDWWNLAPSTGANLARMVIALKVDTDVGEVLQSAGIPLSEINDLIWSHAHLDHIGDTSLFPSSATLHYGKGIAALKPGYPDDPDSGLLASDFVGRPNNEVDFSKSNLEIGGFSALDFYGDGSFYLLNTPGHAPGHLSGLARVTSSQTGQGVDTFILFGGDVCHFCGMLRPNHTHPFPESKFPDSALRVADISDPGALLKRHPRSSLSKSAPPTDSVEALRVATWCLISTAEYSAYENPDMAQLTLNQLREAFDEADNVFVAIAHDNNLLLKVDGKPLLPTLNDTPAEDINGWYEKGWKDKLYWAWLGELGKEGKDGEVVPMEPHVVGLWKDGKKYDSVDEIFGTAQR
ncbi:hypothetical protein F5884DRAFT_875556 [Xylogone sp. PMI_703]|nr:hypothetical protein F5884DRAFT_875556 [Xylogone sp. PMI_703]